MSFLSRLRRHLSYANVVASVALFAALGGSAYAASKINGGSIVNQSIAGKKLKNGTVTSKQIKAGTITSKQVAANSLSSSVINVSTLGTVPSAQTAVTATTAETATKATTATSATSAQTAAEATTAETAKSAAEADYAKTAGDAETVGGASAEELTLSCPPETEIYGGMCWDEIPRPVKGWIQAAKDCGDEGGRLPSLSELIAFISQPGPQVAAHNWSSDVADLETGTEVVFTSDETGRAKSLSTAPFGYRCLFYRSN
jgi:hypothetical protein